MRTLMAYIYLSTLALFLGTSAQAQPMTFGEGASFEEIMKNDHKVISKLFDEMLDDSKKDQRGANLDALKKGLDQHMSAEEKYLYPVIQKNKQTEGDAVKAKDEHMAAKAELAKIDPKAEDSVFKARLDVLKSLINSHVSFEESTLLTHASQWPTQEQQKITENFQKVYR